MTWPEVLRWLALVAGIAASIAGLAWTLGRIFRPWMREAAREASDDVRAEVKAEVRALAEKLATNDFPHVEARIERGLQDVGERIERVEARQREAVAAMEARIGERLDRARQDRKDMEIRILAAVQRRPDTTDDPEAAGGIRSEANMEEPR